MSNKINQTFYYYKINKGSMNYYFYTTVILDTKEEILEWALNKGLIEIQDLLFCEQAIPINLEEVKELEDIMYKEWWAIREKKLLEGIFIGNIPPKLGVQLD